MKYDSVAEIAKKWNVSERTVRNYCASGRIEGAVLKGKTWCIPENAERPKRKNGKETSPERTLLSVLREEKARKIKGGIYHKIQIELTYNSNHIEGSRLTHDQTRFIYETNTIGMEKTSVLNVDDIVETANHFKCIDMIIDAANQPLSEAFLKSLHRTLKSGTSDSRKDWFAVGDYKKMPNEVGGMKTTLPEQVSGKIKKLLAEYNAKEEALFKQDPKNEDKPYKEKKLEEAFICSGERDSLCVASLGYSPLWFNSETYKVSPEEIKEIYKYVEKLYNIPDIDSTGIRKATELALKYMDILTVWLPSWLTTYKDWRGKPRKDFRDFMELRQRNEDFRNLLKMAMPARFWEITQNEKTGKKQYEIDADCLHYFLKLNGFHALRDENSANTQYVRVVGRIVSSIKGKDIRTFLRQFARERYLDRNIRNLILNSPRMSDGALENLDEITLDFTSYTRKSQYFFFPNAVWEVTGGKIETQLANMGITDRYVWEENVIPHNVKVLPDMFTIKRNKLSDGTDAWDIDIHEHASNIFRYLINTSRTHWRKELEYSLDHLDNEEADRYRLEHIFDIAGPNLEPAEIAEQKQNLINKIFAIGYILHRYKSPSRAWSPYAMDNKLGEDGDSNGRSGKSFLFKTFDHFMKTVKLSGRNPKLMDNPHVFDQITQHTDFLLIDDCDRYTSTGLFYDVISSDMTVNPKNNQSFNIPYKDSPKIGFTTNFVPVDFDPSTEGRLLYMVFSDYYHQRTPDNDYLETRSIRDDFGKNLLTDYNEEEWNQDINFMLQCCKFYLSLIDDSVKILPPMDNIMRRKYKADMGAGFEDWAKGYFAEDGDKVNVLVDRQSAFQDFINFSGMRKCTMQRFTKALKGFANLTPYVKCLNPEVMRNSSGRITRKIDGKSCDMIYIQTVSATGINDMEMGESEANRTPAQTVIKGFTDTKTDSGNVPF